MSIKSETSGSLGLLTVDLIDRFILKIERMNHSKSSTWTLDTIKVKEKKENQGKLTNLIPSFNIDKCF